MLAKVDWKEGFSILSIPTEISQEEELLLRQYVKNLCAEKGFQPSNRLTSEIIEGVRNADRKAWDSFVPKHQKRFIRHVERLLEKGKNRTILEPEDVLNQTL